MRVAMLTGGGDCPGLNAVIRAVVRKGERQFGDELVGFIDGWRGVIDGETRALDVQAMRGTLPRGGTVLGSSRTNPFKIDGGVDACRASLERLGIDALIAIGGDDTLGVADKLAADGVPVVGVPKTIDNDLSATEMTFGFDTAVQIATEAIDRLHTTAESHHRVMVCEVMGRHAGHIAVWSGIAGGATMILIPEEPFDIEAVCDALVRRHDLGNYASIVVVAEGATPKEGTMATVSGEVDQFGHVRLGGIGQQLAEQIEARTGYETRMTILGHVQRGGTPTAFDRVLATRFGVAAIDAVHDGAFGMMMALQAGEIVRVPLSAGVGAPKLVDPALYHGVAEVFFAG
jgi:6-phosphofructokinase 1